MTAIGADVDSLSSNDCVQQNNHLPPRHVWPLCASVPSPSLLLCLCAVAILAPPSFPRGGFFLLLGCLAPLFPSFLSSHLKAAFSHLLRDVMPFSRSLLLDLISGAGLHGHAPLCLRFLEGGAGLTVQWGSVVASVLFPARCLARCGQFGLLSWDFSFKSHAWCLGTAIFPLLAFRLTWLWDSVALIKNRWNSFFPAPLLCFL